MISSGVCRGEIQQCAGHVVLIKHKSGLVMGSHDARPLSSYSPLHLFAGGKSDLWVCVTSSGLQALSRLDHFLGDSGYVALHTFAFSQSSQPIGAVLASLEVLFPGDSSRFLSVFSGQVFVVLGCHPPLYSGCHSDLSVFCKRSLEQSHLGNNV